MASVVAEGFKALSRRTKGLVVGSNPTNTSFLNIELGTGKEECKTIKKRKAEKGNRRTESSAGRRDPLNSSYPFCKKGIINLTKNI